MQGGLCSVCFTQIIKNCKALQMFQIKLHICTKHEFAFFPQTPLSQKTLKIRFNVNLIPIFNYSI